MPARIALANVAIAEGDAAEALAVATELIEAEPGNARAHALAGDAHLAAGRPREAAEAYRTAHELAPSAALVVRTYQSLAAAGEEAPGIALVESWLARQPGDQALRLLLAGALHRVGDREASARAYRRVLEAEPENFIALNNLANVYQETDDPRALELARQAYEAGPEYPETLDTYGWLLVESGELEQGLRFLELAFEKAPESAVIRGHLAEALERLGRPAEARAIAPSSSLGASDEQGPGPAAGR